MWADEHASCWARGAQGRWRRAFSRLACVLEHLAATRWSFACICGRWGRVIRQDEFLLTKRLFPGEDTTGTHLLCGADMLVVQVVHPAKLERP